MGITGFLALACSGDARKSPADAVEQYYDQQTLTDGDVLGHRPLLEQDSLAVFATRIEQGDSTGDWYAFLTRDKKGWHVDTVRTLEFPDRYSARADSIETGLLPDSALSPSDANLPLTVSSDSTIKAYLMEHQLLLDSIVKLFMQRSVMSTVDVSAPVDPEIRDGSVLSTNRNARLQTLLERAGVTRIFRDARYPYCTFVRINGIDRAEVGFVHAEDRCLAPEMRPDQFIYVERVANEWFVYKVM